MDVMTQPPLAEGLPVQPLNCDSPRLSHGLAVISTLFTTPLLWLVSRPRLPAERRQEQQVGTPAPGAANVLSGVAGFAP